MDDKQSWSCAPGCVQCEEENVVQDLGEREQSKDDNSQNETEGGRPPECQCQICRRKKHQKDKRGGNCPPGCQQCKEDKEEEEQKRRIEQPWLFETPNLIIEPPDVNYRKLILDDQEAIDLPFEDKKVYFTERCYDMRSVMLQQNV